MKDFLAMECHISAAQICLARDLVNICSCNESVLPSTYQYEGPDSFVPTHEIQTIAQLVYHFAVQRIKHGRAVKGDSSDLVLHLEQQAFVNHLLLLVIHEFSPNFHS